MHAAKKATPKPRRPITKNHGGDCPRAVALRHWLECVKGDRYRAILTGSGTLSSEKNVPLRKDIGTITKVLKAPMS